MSQEPRFYEWEEIFSGSGLRTRVEIYVPQHRADATHPAQGWYSQRDFYPESEWYAARFHTPRHRA